ncbi:MAG: nucleotidyltransferase domain-containing protein [Rhodomicrobium sp.]
MTKTDPIISKFRSALGKAYGPRLERVVLYGSRARGDAKPESDYDVAVFLKDMTNRWDEFGTLAGIEVDLLDETGAVVHAMPYPAGSWRDRASPLMYEIRRDGLDL